MTKKKSNDCNSEVGYGKPPKSGPFKPGQSGNKKGRPKGSKNFKTDLKDILEETIPIMMNGKKKHITKQRAMLMTMVSKAVKGDAKAVSVMFNIIAKILPDEQEDNQLDQLTETDQEILKQFSERVLKNTAQKETEDM